MRTLAILSFLSLAVLLGGSAANTGNTKERLAALHNGVCNQKAGDTSPWNLRQLYNCKTQSFYLPYQLWTGANWNGDKNAPCMHKADLNFYVDGTSSTTIKGPYDWENPHTGRRVEVWERVKTNGSKTQRFACHELGIGRVYDSRRTRYWAVGRCKFPAGYGWKIGKRRYCKDTSIEITSIATDERYNLKSLTFKWWSGSNLDHVYVYAPNEGMLHAWKQ